MFFMSRRGVQKFLHRFVKQNSYDIFYIRIIPKIEHNKLKMINLFNNFKKMIKEIQEGQAKPFDPKWHFFTEVL